MTLDPEESVTVAKGGRPARRKRPGADRDRPGRDHQRSPFDGASEVEHARKRPVLSERQRQVARALERGLSSEEIAAELGIAARTVKAHCDSLRRQLGVTRRRLIVPAFRHLEGRA